ncbi:MAG: hypothetical protein ACPGRD_05960 [Planktomarina sp.]
MSSQHLGIHYDMPTGEEGSGPVKVGWLTSGKQPKVLFDPPERLRMVDPNREHAKSASRCPAVINMESRYFAVKSPYDFNLGFKRDKDGKPEMVNLNGTKSPIRAGKLGQVFHMTPEREWRYKDRPTIQLTMPYMFIADEPVFVNQVDAFLHYRKQPLPGTIFGGRFPITNWPRGLMWAFEWHDITKPLVVNRGDPLFYIMFETVRPERPIQLVEAEETPELKEYIAAVAGAVNYVDKTFSMFKAAERLRPKTLLTPKKR